MSMDILAGAGGRFASLAKSTPVQQSKNDGQAGGDQEMSDRTKLFGALLEKPQSKEAETAEQKDDSDPQAAEAVSADASLQSHAYIVPQNLFSLAANLAVANDENSPLSLEGDKQSVVVTDTNEDGLNIVTPDVELSALSPDTENKLLEVTTVDKQQGASADTKTGNRPEAVLEKNALKQDSAFTERASVPGEAVAVKPSAEGSNVQDRIVVQPLQQASRGNGTVEAKTEIVAQQASARIDDIQLISERSFGAVKTLHIRLDPVELGAVTARIRVVADNIEVHLIADKAHGAEALASDRSMIEKALKVAGVTEDSKITVTIAERGTLTTQQTTPNQSAGHQQGSGMQSDAGGRNGSQGQSQAHFMGGESRQNGESADTRRGTSGARGSNAEAILDTSSLSSGRHRGLVV